MNSKRNSSVGKLAIGAIAVGGALFFGLLQFSKRELHPPLNPVASVVVVPAKVSGAMDTIDTADSIYLTDAIPRTLSVMLAQVRGLAPKAPPSTIEVDRVHEDLKTIAAAYQVSVVLTSVIKVEGQDLTLSVQIVDPQTHDVLWSHQYAGKRDHFNDLIRQAADGAGHALQASSPHLLTATGLAASSEAELHYRQGEYFFTRFHDTHDSADSARAVSSFQQALALDPKLAVAAADIALLMTSAGDIERWANKAVEIDPACGRAYMALALAEKQRGDWLAGLRYDLKAMHLSPKYDVLPQASFADDLRFVSPALSLAGQESLRRIDPLGAFAAPDQRALPPDFAVKALDILQEVRARGELPPYLEKALAVPQIQLTHP